MFRSSSASLASWRFVDLPPSVENPPSSFRSRAQFFFKATNSFARTGSDLVVAPVALSVVSI
jgi:hypothetical protein